jgi:hypothetical protein
MMTEQKTTSHRAQQRLEAANGTYKELYKLIAELRAKTKKDWPDYVFVPHDQILYALAGGYEAFIQMLKVMNQNHKLHESSVLKNLAGIIFAKWRVTQGIYRFDPTLYAELIHTKNTGELPVDVLVRLPEWCVYIETPGLTIPTKSGSFDPIHGVWATIDVRLGNNTTLSIMPDVGSFKEIPPATDLDITSGTIEQGIITTINTWKEKKYNEKELQDHVTETTNWVNPIINLLLYLCSGADYAGSPPRNPTPVKTKRGLRFFPPTKPTTWEVGVRMGAALRAAYAAQGELEQDGATRTLRPHIRRAHWHGFRSGPMLDAQGEPIQKENRRFDLRWLPPIPVNIGEGEELPAVIKPVQGGVFH